MKITIAGLGYVGLPLSVLLSQNHEVIAYDIDINKIKKLNKHISPNKDEYIEKFLTTKKLNLTVTQDYEFAFKSAEYIIICTPTDYNEKKGKLDTSKVEDIIKKAKSVDSSATIIIKSTIPIGYTEKVKKKYNLKNIFFSPEFCREDKALFDNLHPSRIIIGDNTPPAIKYGEIMKECVAQKEVKIIYMSSTEAEAVKLFANTYLALRVSYFNELDTYAELNDLNVQKIIEGVCTDPRIGDYYNNPSFGYGGYCLIKDTKQLIADYKDIPNQITRSTIIANIYRKNHIINMILEKKPKTVCFYRLTMKKKSDNFRNSAILEIIQAIAANNIDVCIYEPLIKEDRFNNFKVIHNFNEIDKIADLVVANRFEEELKNLKCEIYTRDLFRRD